MKENERLKELLEFERLTVLTAIINDFDNFEINILPYNNENHTRTYTFTRKEKTVEELRNNIYAID
jgi:hypothetical protein